ncbi:M4 family metallopeptidase, partial [bacterium]|nr:M4 family metallopeptidase [bacterium]
GDGQSGFSRLAGSLDVIALEYTHAVVQHTANLEYKFQSGALNETFADIGGVCVDDDDFLLGEDIVSLQYFPTGSMRNMGDPHNGATGPQDFTWQPAHMSEYQNLTMEEDNGGVHVNNGITNFAACKILSRLGRQEGQRILFRALENYLTQQSNFSDFRIAAVRAAGDLFGEDSMQQQTVMTAFDEVGIVQGSGTTPPPDSPPVSGSQYILAVNDEVDLFDIEDHSLVISDGFDDLSEDPAFYYLTNTQALTPSGRPIAVDAYGQDIYFVDADYNLRAIRPDGSGEEIVSDTGDWWSIALSPSGRYLAMTRDISENIIVVYDLRDDTVTELPLFHPTTDHNNNYADVVDYADSLAFLDDHLLAYDCSNSIQSPDGGTLDFWDVNVIDVTDGRIFPVLPPQRAGVHVGNPIFASTNASILCVEVFEDGVGNSVTGINLVSGDASVILDNGLDLAYPDYSVDDQDLLITHTNMAGRRDLYRLPLNADKISPAGTPVFLLPEVKLPVWFAQGTPPTAVVAFSSASSQAQECDSVVQIPVSLSETPTGTVTVDYAVTGGNAIGSGVDYTLESGILTFEGSAIAAIPLSLNNDDLHEQNESLTITLSRPVNAWLGDADRHTFTIRDDDSTTGVARNVWMLYE